MCDVFLSYSREDLVIAGQVAEHLREANLDVFWDREIPVGKTWESHIEEKLMGARCVVVLWSSNSVASDWVRAEAGEAADRDVLVPATIDATSPPFRFRTIQTADLAEWHGNREHTGIANLTAAARMLAEVDIEREDDPAQSSQILGSGRPLAIAEVETGLNRGRSVTLTEGMTGVTIGCSHDCDFVIDDDYISRHHCRLLIQPTGHDSRAGGQYSFSLIDSGSTSGTRVNGEHVERADLRSGDRVQIGTVRFIFRVLD